MAKSIVDMTWLPGRAQVTATASVSAALVEVTGYRQRGMLERGQPTDVIVQIGLEGLYLVYPAATAAASFA